MSKDKVSRLPSRDYEHRRHNRYGVRAVSGHVTLPLEVRVTNMSLTGLAIEAAVPLEIGGRHHFTLRHEEDLIQLETEVVWCRPVQPEGKLLGEALPRYEIGLDFQKALDRKATELLGFLQHNVVIEVGQRLPGRFKIAGEASHSSCRVKELSFSETLIETEPGPEIGETCVVELRKGDREVRICGEVTAVRRGPRPSGEPVHEVRVAFGKQMPETQQALEEMVTAFLE